jgi:ribose/xylose/arabinose/galactoside ABC-type transport system permease subunit
MTTQSVPQGATATGRKVDPLAILGRYGAMIFLIVLCIIFAILEPAFLSTRNIFNVIRQVSIYGMLAIGMTFVILTSGIDLSIGSVLALAGLVAAAAEKGSTGLLDVGAGQAQGLGLPIAVASAIAVGLMAGAANGLAISRLRVPAFIVTLGAMSIFRGMALVFSKGQPISAFRDAYKFWGQGMIGPVPVPVILFLVSAVVAHIVLRYTKYGRHVYAVGGNQEAARLSGLNVKGIILSVYVIMGFFAGLSGFILSSRLNSAEQVAGIGYELTVIAGVVIGGTSLTMGGEGGVFGTVIGILLIGVLSNGLTLMNVSAYYQQIIIGLIIIFAVFFDQVTKQRRR